MLYKSKRPGAQQKLSSEQVKWLIDPETLTSMSHLSLKLRANRVKDKLGLDKFSEATLWRYYARYGVKYKRPDYTYWKSRAENLALIEKQFDFVQRLSSLIKESHYDEIIYLDETTFHLWHKVSRCWLRPGMKLSMLKYRGPSITVIGAISE